MFTDNPNLIQIGAKVWVYKNFISKEDVAKVNALYDDLPIEKFMYDSHELDWYKDKSGPNNMELVNIWKKAGEFLGPEYVAHPNLSMQYMKPGDEPMFVHADSPGEGEMEQLVSTDRWSSCCIISYGAVIYFGDFTGGEIFYPSIDKDGKTAFDRKNEPDRECLSYAPQPGDLVIHDSHSPWEHGVTEVKSGKRYAYSLFVMHKDANPGSFYNYNTKESNDQIENDLQSWGTPLFVNPQFAHRPDAY